jgi:hypothetical protein
VPAAHWCRSLAPASQDPGATPVSPGSSAAPFGAQATPDHAMPAVVRDPRDGSGGTIEDQPEEADPQRRRRGRAAPSVISGSARSGRGSAADRGSGSACRGHAASSAVSVDRGRATAQGRCFMAPPRAVHSCRRRNKNSLQRNANDGKQSPDHLGRQHLQSRSCSHRTKWVKQRSVAGAKRLHRDWHRSSMRQPARELCEDCQVGVEPDPLNAPTRSGSSAHSCFNRPNSRSTAPRERYSFAKRSESRGISGWRRAALNHVEAGLHSPVGQRPLGRVGSCSRLRRTSTRRARTTAGDGRRA